MSRSAALALSLEAPVAQAGQAEGLRLSPVRAVRPPVRLPRRSTDPLRIAITSGKGGTGKTTITANLAALWARRGRRVLVVDGDLGLAGLDLALGVRPQRTLADVVLEGRPLEDALVTGPFGITLLAAAVGRFELANLGVAARSSLLRAIDALAARFDVVLFDTGAGLGATAVEISSLADEVLMVVTPDPAALRDAYAMAKLLSERAGCREVAVIVNQVEPGARPERAHERLAGLVDRFLDLRVRYAGGIARDGALAEGGVHGIPFVLTEPRSQPAQVLGELVSSLDREVMRTC